MLMEVGGRGKTYYGVGGEGVKLSRAGILPAQQAPSQLNYCQLHAQTHTWREEEREEGDGLKFATLPVSQASQGSVVWA